MSMRVSYETPKKLAFKRRMREIVLTERRLEIRTMTGKLREHARRCRAEKGYRTHNGRPRYETSMYITGLVKKLEHRVELNLSFGYWLTQCRELLAALERENG